MKIWGIAIYLTLFLMGCGSEAQLKPHLEYSIHQFVRRGEPLRVEDGLNRTLEGTGINYSAHEFALDTRHGEGATFVKKFGSVVCAGGRGLLTKPQLQLVDPTGATIQTVELDPATREYPLAVADESEYRLRLFIKDSLSCSYGLNFAIR